jgi:hypothetical protein
MAAMRRLLLMLAACGGSDPAGGDAGTDSPPNQCEPQPAIGQFTRRAGNPFFVAGGMFGDGNVDTELDDPDVSFDGSLFHLYYGAEHSTQFGISGPRLIRHATSTNNTNWSVDDAPTLERAADPAWDSARIGAPTVVFDPNAPADRRYLMLYSGSNAFTGFVTPTSIGAAISADGVTFTRLPVAESRFGEAGLVLIAQDVYPGIGSGTQAGFIDDPELVLVDGTYHLLFSSFTCDGTNCDNVIASGVGHATSSDGIHWTVAQTPVKSLLRASADDRTGGRAPSVIYDAAHCKYELWLTNDQPGDVSGQPVQQDGSATVLPDNMAGVWKAESSDAIQWSINYSGQRDLAWNMASPAAGEHLGLRVGADVAEANGGRLMLFVGFDDQNVPAGSTLRTGPGTTRSGVMTMSRATRDLP